MPNAPDRPNGAAAPSRGLPGGLAGPDRLAAALVAAAAGDALGWPYESNNQRVDRPRPGDMPTGEFTAWVRRTGGRFLACEERIAAGDYSDDTQLLVATARALRAAPGAEWFEAFAQAELPTWLAYERGGGGATKRAARHWAAGRPPWVGGGPASVRHYGTGGTTVGQYFDAGGNGVAMRILPHAYVAGGDPVRLRAEVLLNGIATHGHPRALVGGLVFAAAAAAAFQHAGTWRLGELLDAVEASADVWRPPPSGRWVPMDWWEAAGEVTRGRYGDDWEQAVREVDDALALVREHLRRGAVAVDHDALTALGAFRRDVSGAGTVAAAAALLLASRHAADPATGVRTAAYAAGADTDTIACMTAGLLGAMLGDEWVPAGWRRVQDAKYLAQLATQLHDAVVRGAPPSLFEAVPRPWTERDTTGLLGALTDGAARVVTLGPLGAATVRERSELRPVARGALAVRFCLRTEEGQTVYVVRSRRDRATAVREGPPSGWGAPPPVPPTAEPSAVAPPVRDRPQPEPPADAYPGLDRSPAHARVLRDVDSLRRAVDPSMPARDLLRLLDTTLRAIRGRMGPYGDEAPLRSGTEFHTWLQAAVGDGGGREPLADAEMRALARLAWRLLYGRPRDPA